MFASQVRKEIAIRVLLIVVVLFNTFGAITVSAQGPEPTASPTPTSTETVTETPTVEPSVTPTVTETPIPVTDTVTPTPTTTAAETPSAEVTATETIVPSATASVAPTSVTSPVLSLSADPQFITPGGNLHLSWSINGLSIDGITLILQINIPAGFALQGNNDGTLDNATHILSIPVVSTSGQIHLKASDTISDANFVAKLIKEDEVLSQADLLVPTHEQFNMDAKGGTITAKSGKIKVQFPKDALPESATIQIGNPNGDAVPAYPLLGGPFEITAFGKQSGNQLKHFSKPLSIFVSYANLGISNAQAGDLHLYWWDPDTQKWNGLPTTVDTATQTLQGLTDHFTVFDIDLNDWQANNVPTVDSFQVSSFTGAATYSLPIQVPAGPGGFQPNLTLTYNSQVVDQASLTTQASWVGMGWSLETGSIERDTHGTSDWTGDDTFLLNVAGVSTRIVQAADGTYHAADENYWKFTYNGGNTWTVQDKEGNTYTFGNTAQSVLTYSYLYGSNCSLQQTPYRWMLTKTTNIFNQEINYDYFKQTKNVSCNWIPYPDDTATYPATITYDGGMSQISFGLDASRHDYDPGWSTDPFMREYETYRLGTVDVRQKVNGSYTTIRQYVFNYKANTDSDIIFPGYTWPGGGKTNTLKSVQEVGLGGASSLPAITFAYDNLHLKHVDNGYGGTVDFTFENSDTNPIPWYYSAYAPSFHRRSQIWGMQSVYSCTGPTRYWGVRSGGVIGCTDPNGQGIKGLFLRGVGYDGEYTSTSNYANFVRPGGIYKLIPYVNLDPNMTIQTGLSDGVNDNYASLSQTSYIFQLPVTANQVQPLMNVAGGTGYAYPAGFRFELLNSVYRVTQKKIADGNGHTYTYGYSYTGATVNDATSSPSSVCGFTEWYSRITDSDGCYEYFPRYSEFRGHGQVIETSPDGAQTITTYNQDDLLKGHPSNVTVKDSAGVILSSQNYTYSTNPLSVFEPQVDNGATSPPSHIGVTRTWIYISSAQSWTYALNGTANATETDSIYESTYGNLISQTEKYRAGYGVWPIYRTTQTDYFPNSSSSYLVGLPIQVRTLDSVGNVLASTLYLYDGNTGDYTIPITPAYGKLTATRTRVKADGSQWSQVSYDYDQYGNRTMVTTYKDYATAYNTTPPSTNKATTYTCYGSGGTLGNTACVDDGYHVYPLWSRNELGQQTTWRYDYLFGVPLTESDPNDPDPTSTTEAGNTTISAQYDPFGRINKLIRPGDDSTNPTIIIKYYDASPFQTEIRQRIDNNRYVSVHRYYDGLGRQTKIENGTATYDPAIDPILTTTVLYQYPSFNSVQQSMPFASNETPIYTTTTTDTAAHTTTVWAPDQTHTTTIQDGLNTIVQDALGNSTATSKDVWGRVASVTPPTGPSISYTYDELNHMLTATRGSNSTTSTTDFNPGINGLISWWNLDETSGTRYDSMGANNLTSNNNVTSIAGKQGNAGQFTAANSQYLSLPDNAALSTGDIDFTVSAWVMLTSKSDVMFIVSKRDSSTVQEYNLAYDNVSDRFTFAIFNSTGSLVGLAYSNNLGSPALNTWYFVTGWHDSVNNTVNIQVNNGLPDTVATTGTPSDTSASFRIGAFFTQAAKFWNGRIDEVVFYKRTLSSGERAWLYKNGLGRSYGELTAVNPGATSLVSWWSLDEASGTRIDSHTTGNTLQDNNTVTSLPGMKGNAAQFTGANSEWLSIPTNTSLSTGDVNFTICGWMNLSSKTTYRGMASKWEASTNSREYYVAYASDLDRYVFGVSSDGTGTNSTTVPANNFGAPVTGNWNFVCAWHDSTANTINIQVNNGAVNSTAWTSGVYSGSAPFNIGRIGGATTSYQDGSTDEVVFYKRSLSSGERTWLYNSGVGRSYGDLNSVNPGTTSLVSWWGLNEISGARNDSHTTGNQLQDNSLVPSTPGVKSYAAQFKAANSQSLSIPDNSSLSLNGTNFTIVGWAKFNSLGTAQSLISKLSTGNLEYQVYTGANDKIVLAAYANTAGTTYGAVQSAATVTTGTWYFIAAEYDGTAVKVSLNGPGFTSAAYSSGVVDSNNSFRLGAHGSGAYTDGALDEVAIYKRALSPSEIGWLYNNGLGRTYSELTPTTPPNPVVNTTTLTYDNAGRKLTMVDPDMGNWSYTYDALGNLTSQLDARGQRICLYYDALNRLTGKQYLSTGSCPTNNPTLDVSYTYDAGTNGKGQRTGMTSLSNGQTVTNSWTYDTRGHVASATVNAGTAYTTQWTQYNSADQPVTMTYPDGEVVRNTYDSRMLLDKVDNTSGYTYVNNLDYDSASRLTTLALGNGLTQSYTYYPWSQQGGRLQTLAAGSLQNLGYTYDALGNIRTITESTNSNQKQCFQYDTLNRLTNATTYNDSAQGCTTQSGAGNYDEAYTYDPASGNLDVKAGVDLNYNDTAHAHAVTHIGSTQKYWYDANGNQITRTVGTDTFNLTYDAENRLIEVKKNSVSIGTFVYDGDGNRVKSTMGTTTTTFVGNWYEITGTGQVTKYYYAGTQRIAMRKYTVPSPMTVEYFLGDHLGSTSLTTDNTGAKVSEIRYKPWGEMRSWPTSVPSTTPSYMLPNYTFTGQYSYMDDPTTTSVTEGFGLMFYNARWYDPAIGRFAQADTIIPGGVQGYDRYAYVNNNPIAYADPTGHMATCDFEASKGCGHISTTEEIYKSFDKEHGGRFEGLFAEYYAALNEADRAVATGDPNADASVAYAAAAKEQALNFVPQKDFDPAMALDPGTILKFSETMVSLGKEAGGLAAGIGVSNNALQHIIDRHTEGGPNSTAKSIFSDGVNIVDLIRQAEQTTPQKQAGGNFERIVDAGRIIGIDRNTGKPTSIYTVITDSSGNLVTAFPGVP